MGTINSENREIFTVFPLDPTGNIGGGTVGLSSIRIEKHGHPSGIFRKLINRSQRYPGRLIRLHNAGNKKTDDRYTHERSGNRVNPYPQLQHEITPSRRVIILRHFVRTLFVWIVRSHCYWVIEKKRLRLVKLLRWLRLRCGDVKPTKQRHWQCLRATSDDLSRTLDSSACRAPAARQ